MIYYGGHAQHEGGVFVIYSFVELNGESKPISDKNLDVAEALEKVNFLVRLALDRRGNRITITILKKGIVLQRLTEQLTFIPEDGFFGEMDFNSLLLSLVAYVNTYPMAFSLSTAARDFIEKKRRQF